MASMSGADADALDRVARELERSAGQLAASNTRLGRRIHQAPWHGQGAEHFRQQWGSVHSRALRDAASFLDEAGDRLRTNAAQQREASTARGVRVIGGTRPRMRDADDSILRDLLLLVGLPATIAGLGTDALEAILKVASKRLVTVSGYTTKAGKVVSSYVRWAQGEAPFWRRVVGDAKNVSKISKSVGRVSAGLMILGGVLSGLGQYNKDGKYGTSERVTRATAVGATRAVVGFGAAKGGAAAGAAIGTMIFPGVGTVIGAGVGAVGGGILANVAMDKFDADRYVADAASWAHKKGSAVVKDVASTGRDVARKGAGLISGGANLAKKGLGALW